VDLQLLLLVKGALLSILKCYDVTAGTDGREAGHGANQSGVFVAT
jgi:hypothetical protein